MKILTYTPHGKIPDQRGFSVSLVAQNFPKYFSGVEHLHVCDAESGVKGLVVDSIYGKIYRINESKLYKRLFQKLTRLDPYPMYRKMADIANKFEPDIIHVHQQEFPTERFRRYLSCNAKIVIHAHTIRDFEAHLGLADMYVGVSQFVAEHLINSGAPKDRVVVVHNGLDIDTFKPIESKEKLQLRTELGIPCDSPVVVFFGRKEAQKGFDLFLDAVDSLSQEMPKLRAFAIGPTLPNAKLDASYKSNCERRALLAVKGILTDLEPIPHKRLAQMIALSDVAILPSRQEPQGMAVIEAMASGSIVISADVEGIKESIEHGRNGLLVNPFAKKNEVTLALAKVLNDLGAYRSMSSFAAASALHQFSWDTLATKLQCFYQNLVETGGVQ